MGHTMSVHSQNDDVILQFGLKKPAFRICVNTPTTHGSIGLTTGLDPAMTLGCGGWGGNITSDNISPQAPAEHQAPGLRTAARRRLRRTPSQRACRLCPQRTRLEAASESRLPKAPARPVARGISAAGAGRPDRPVPVVPRLSATGWRSRGHAGDAATRTHPRRPQFRRRPQLLRRPGPAGVDGRRHPSRLRLRGRRPGSAARRPQTRGRRADDHHAVGAGSGRGAEGLRAGRLASLICPQLLRAVGLTVDRHSIRMLE